MSLFFVVLFLACFLVWICFGDAGDYAQHIQESPMLVLAGTDLREFSESLHELRTLTVQIAAYYPPQERRTIETNLAPQTFLESLPSLEKSRQAVLSHPSPWRALVHWYHLRRSLSAMNISARSLARAHQTYPINNTIAFVDGTTDNQAILQAVMYMSDRAAELQHDADSLLLCSFIPFFQCSHATTQPRTPPTTREVHQVDRATLGKITRIHEQLTDYATTSPKLIAMESACSLATSTIFATWYRTRDNHLLRERAPLDDILVIPYVDIPSTFTPTAANTMRSRGVSPNIHTWLKERDVEFLYQPIGGLYYCLQSGTDVGAQARVLGLYESLRESPLTFPDADAFYLEIEKLQDSFLSGDTLDMNQAALLMQRIQQVLDTESELPPEIRARLTALTILWKAGTYRLDEVIRAAVAHNIFVLAILQKGDSLPTATLLAMRSYPSLYFMWFNETIYKQSPRIVKTHQRFGTSRFGIKTLTELEHTNRSEDLQTKLEHGFFVMDTLLQETMRNATSIDQSM